MTKTSLLLGLASILATSAFAQTAAAETPVAAAPASEDNRFGWGFSFVLENDLFNHGDDRNYTNGIQLSVITPKVDSFEFFQRITNVAVGRWEANPPALAAELTLSQAMYTPRDLTLVNPDPYDRPYAGILLASLGLIWDTTETNDHRFDQVAYYIGTTGSASRADDAQRYIHRRLGAQRPEGWDSQIGSRLVGGVAYRVTILYSDNQREPHFQVLPHAGFALGNVTTDGEAGLTVRAGFNMPTDFGLPRLAPSLPGSSFFRAPKEAGIYVFAGAAERYVFYDVTLDEEPSHGVNYTQRRQWVGDLQAGVAFNVGCFRAGYTHVWRTEQFRGQNEGSGFGAVSLSWSLRNGGGHVPWGWATCGGS